MGNNVKIYNRNKTVVLAVCLLFTVIVFMGCASRSEVKQFQADHTEFRGHLQRIDFQMDTYADSIDSRLDRIETNVERLESLLGGNVSDYLLAQEDLLRAMKADQSAVSSELERLIVTLSSRVDESEERLQRLLLQLDTFNQLVVQVLGDSLSSVGMDATESQRLFQQSYADFLKGEIEVSRMGFDIYVKQYPTTSMADDALYWIGETFLAESLPDSARLYFIRMEDAYPESNRMATALLKRGIIRMEKEDYVAAERLFNRVIKEHPGGDDSDQAGLRLRQILESESLEEPPR